MIETGFGSNLKFVSGSSEGELDLMEVRRSHVSFKRTLGVFTRILAIQISSTFAKYMRHEQKKKKKIFVWLGEARVIPNKTPIYHKFP